MIGWYTPLHIALGNGFHQLCTTFIQLGGNPWLKSKFGEDIFVYAHKRGFKALAEEFRNKVMRSEMQKSIDKGVTGLRNIANRRVSVIHEEVEEHEEEDHQAMAEPTQQEVSFAVEVARN